MTHYFFVTVFLESWVLLHVVTAAVFLVYDALCGRGRTPQPRPQPPQQSGRHSHSETETETRTEREPGLELGLEIELEPEPGTCTVMHHQRDADPASTALSNNAEDAAGAVRAAGGQAGAAAAADDVTKFGISGDAADRRCASLYYNVARGSAINVGLSLFVMIIAANEECAADGAGDIQGPYKERSDAPVTCDVTAHSWRLEWIVLLYAASCALHVVGLCAWSCEWRPRTMPCRRNILNPVSSHV